MSHQFFFSPHILDNLMPPTSGFDVVQDISEPRLRLYITSRGVKTFFTRKRVDGRDVRLVIGRYPDVDIDYARAAVNEILANIKRPQKVHHKKITFKKLCDTYVARRVHRVPASSAKLVRTMDRLWADLYQKNVDDIMPADLLDINSNSVIASGPTTANRMLEIMKSIFKFAIENGYLKTSPAATIQKTPENRRTMTLSDDGVRKLIAAISGELDQNLRSAFLMLIYGFESKSKIFKMQWRDLDFNNDTWDNRPLSDAAVVLLRDLPQDGRYVFPGRVRTRHLSDPRTAWGRMTRRAGVGDVRMDDVHKFLMRRLEWSGHRETLRQNMNRVLDEIVNIRDEFPN